jgi:hypothetical protein
MTEFIQCLGCIFQTCELCKAAQSSNSRSNSHYQSLHENQTDGGFCNCDKPEPKNHTCKKCGTILHERILPENCGVCKLELADQLAVQDMSRFKVKKFVKKSKVKKTLKKSNVKKTKVKKSNVKKTKVKKSVKKSKVKKSLKKTDVKKTK